MPVQNHICLAKIYATNYDSIKDRIYPILFAIKSVLYITL